MSREPVWLSRFGVLALHDALLAEHGGVGGIRDACGLESALDRPRNRFVYEKCGVPTLGATYAIALVRAHAFVDGNKRTAFVAAALFLERNGHDFTGPEAEVVMQMIALAAKTVTEATFAKWFCSWSSPRRQRSRRR